MRIITGLVEPHFMAGFSGGRKAVCPGLADLDTIRNFHGYAFMADPASRNANLNGNPVHEEALSVARRTRVDFSLNVVVNRERHVVGAYAGELEAAHAAACEYVRAHACPKVAVPADIVVTSSGGSPLDATFYQCVKGFVSCLPAVKPGGTIVAFGACGEGVGSTAYAATMRSYAGRWRAFLEDIRRSDTIVKDQWQFQMHTRTLDKVGEQNLWFVSDRLARDTLDTLSVQGIAAAKGTAARAVQELFDDTYRPGMRVAVFPEGPYCAPVDA
jgi:nickel-dependent lactate racemase